MGLHGIKWLDVHLPNFTPLNARLLTMEQIFISIIFKYVLIYLCRYWKKHIALQRVGKKLEVIGVSD
jgi:hypothetical protein